MPLMFYLNFHCNQIQMFNSPESKAQVSFTHHMLIFSRTTQPNWTKPGYYTPWKILFQNCVWWFFLTSKILQLCLDHLYMENPCPIVFFKDVPKWMYNILWGFSRRFDFEQSSCLSF